MRRRCVTAVVASSQTAHARPAGATQPLGEHSLAPLRRPPEMKSDTIQVIGRWDLNSGVLDCRNQDLEDDLVENADVPPFVRQAAGDEY
jgi:hypothetical protein